MVTRAYGFANGQAITLTRDVGDFWTAEVPYNEDGEYVVELYAEDEAGNIGYMCTILFVVSHHEMKAYIVPRGYAARKAHKGYEACPILEKMAAKLKTRRFGAGMLRRGFAARIQKGGYTVEHIICRHIGD